MAATIKDIANKVGVNPSTVSRVINGTASISEETKKKIRAAMEELDYHPNMLARNLAKGSSHTVALVIETMDVNALSNVFFMQSIFAIEKICHQEGYDLLLTGADTEKHKTTVKELVQTNKVDGIILPVSIVNEELLRFVKNAKLPMVVLGEMEQPSDDVFWVDVNNKEGSRLAVEHLYQMGYHNPALIVENQRTMYERNRIAGYKAAVKKDRSHWIIDAKDDVNCSENTLQHIFRMPDRPDSIICTNNVVAYKVMRILKKLGIRIPEDVGVLTFNSYPLAEFLDPPLSAVVVDTYKMGEEAARFLFEKLKGNAIPCNHFLVNTRIIARESTAKRK